MAGEPTVTLVGNLTADPELRYLDSGVPLCTFTIAATPRSYNRNSGQWEDGDALFMRCTVWREYAENVADSLRKGMQVIATGTLRQNNWETQDGQRRSSIEMTVTDIGPCLRWAKASVERTSGGRGSNQGGGSGSGGFSGQGGSNYGFNQGGSTGFGGSGNSGYGGPAGGSSQDPWAVDSGNAKGGQNPNFDEPPPF